MRILVTGGGGYIGSFMVSRLLDEKMDVLVADSLERGLEGRIDRRAEFKKGNLLEKEFVESLFEGKIDGIIHFAGYISMAESMKEPALYFQNNTFLTFSLLETMRGRCEKIIFSSTAGVYGNPECAPIPENHPTVPTNPYGESKLAVERILHWYQKIYGIRSVALRYFNAAGAALDGSMGEDHDPETHIIPLAIKAAINGSTFSLYGSDYNTSDGTCVRDYIHVLDLVEAHMMALKKIEKDSGSFIYNVGTGKGYSNKEVVEMIKKVTGINFDVQYKERRPGDAGSLVADVSKAQRELGFLHRYSDLKTIVESAWKWHSRKA